MKASIKVGQTADLLAVEKGVRTVDEMVGQTVDWKASKQVVWKVVKTVVQKAGKMGKFEALMKDAWRVLRLVA